VRRAVYSLLWRLLTPLILLRLLWRGLRAPAYWRGWDQRFGIYRSPALTQPCLWLHAVSLGETQAAAPLIRALLLAYPQHPLLVTHMTPTGMQQARTLFGDQVLHAYLPYDFPGAVARFLRHYRPCLGLILETELWPNLFHACQTQQIPVLLINARLSARSAARYQRYLPVFIRQTLATVRAAAVQTAADAARLVSLGLDSSQITVTGNLKFDLSLSADLATQAEALRAQWQPRPSWIAASTHEGEEEQVLRAFAAVRQQLPNCLLVLVPRHPERFNRVARLCEQAGYRLTRRSSGAACGADTEIYLGDTMGELPVLYAACDVAFVGGSLVPVGGHNLLEPAALGIPVLTGPQLFNFEEIARCLCAQGGAQVVPNADALAVQLTQWLADPALRQTIGAQGQRMVAENRGALQRVLQLVAVYL